MPSRFPPKPTEDTGFTLVEVLVALFLVGILGTVIASITIQSTRSTGDVAERSQAQSDLNDALMRVNNNVVHADGFTATAPAELITSNTDPDTATCTLTRYRVTPDSALSVSRAVCSPTPIWEAARAVVTNLDSPSTPFTYYNQAGVAVSPADPADVQRVSVTLTVGAQTMTSSTALREADDIQLSG